MINKNKTDMQIIGLTGQTGAGKSTITKCFEEKGFVIINCDQVTHLIQSRQEVLSVLKANYGSEILLEDGTLNRKMLAAIAFSEPEQTAKLNRIMLPLIRAEIEKMIEKYRVEGKKYILLDAPTLFESNLSDICTRKVSILANEEIRLQRIIIRDSLSEEDALRRIKAQHPDAYYTVRSDFVLRNNGTVDELLRDGRALVSELTRSNNQDGKTALITLISIILVIVVITGLYTITYRVIYSRNYRDTTAAYSDTLNLDQNLLYALYHCDDKITEEEYISKLSDLENLPYGADTATVAAAYFCGSESVNSWLQNSDYSSDGVSLTSIPDSDAASFADEVESALKIYNNLYN